MTPYGTVSAADTYHTALGTTAWTGTDEVKTAALVRASLWLDRTYRSRFPGSKTDGRDQEREWPRTDAIDSDGVELAVDEVPTEIEQATYEAALRELVAPGSLSPDYKTGEQIKSISKKLGPLEKTIVYRDASGTAPVIPAIDALLTNMLLDVSRTVIRDLFRA